MNLNFQSGLQIAPSSKPLLLSKRRKSPLGGEHRQNENLEESRRHRRGHGRPQSLLSQHQRDVLFDVASKLGNHSRHVRICDRHQFLRAPFRLVSINCKSDVQVIISLLFRILGIVFLIFGFLTLLATMIYCVMVFRDARHPKDVNPDDFYWTHHWQKNIGSPEIHYKAEEKYNDDRYSDRYSVSKLSGKYSDKNGRY